MCCDQYLRRGGDRHSTVDAVDGAGALATITRGQAAGCEAAAQAFPAPHRSSISAAAIVGVSAADAEPL